MRIVGEMKPSCLHLPVARILDLGCTVSQHKRIGINAVINARGGQQWRNDLNRIQEVEERRDAQAIRRRVSERVRFYGYGSRTFRRRPELARFLSSYND